MFKRGDLVRFTKEYSDPEERHYILIVIEERGDRMLVEYLNGKSVIRVQECVADYMIEKVMDAEDYIQTESEATK